MSRRIRVYLTLSLTDADGLIDHLDSTLSEARDPTRIEKVLNRLQVLTEGQRPSLMEDMVDGPPEDYDPDQGGT
jgi:hypothetical protein